MNIESLTMDIIERIDYYEKRRFRTTEADCRNLETKYDSNDATAQGFLVAIRKQEHWDGDFIEIAKEILTIRNSKIARYVLIRSVDCTIEFIQEVFDPEIYYNSELQEIARVANCNKILEMIFEYVKCNLGRKIGYPILCCMAGNSVASEGLLNALYRYDNRLSAQIFLNADSQASTDLLMRMFYECDERLKGLHMIQLLQFNREEIDQMLKKYWIKKLIQILKKVD